MKHGRYWKDGDKETRMSNLHYSILRTMGFEETSFSDSTGTISNSVFPV
jgi:hypothetical protein